MSLPERRQPHSIVQAHLANSLPGEITADHIDTAAQAFLDLVVASHFDNAEEARRTAQPHSGVVVERPVRFCDGAYFEVVRPHFQRWRRGADPSLPA
jgi:hypothetical protein